MSKIIKGTWVEIEQIVLKPEERAANLPEETRKVPYVLRVSGFLVEDAEMDTEVHIKTIIGRELSGTLKVVNPSYTHSFGNTVPELLTIGTEAEQ
ncbi:MAG TPA: 2-amino-4-oxopentanoate thiolase subunit OrtA [Anaerolineaceae bacterium]|nr:2-amino-4-oxopentanoate thiolase subunit OrtA [Anaerolineaceae bacterium]HPN52875.1 2-amino-4-oxopentanoate thiolase subunit OrtA [Anaerolineaceae bacterium]